MVNIVEVKSKISNGYTIPYRVGCSDGKIYAVKFPGNFQGKKVLINEFICSELCKKLGLPILEYSLINVKHGDYVLNMDMDMEIEEGTAFGTVYNDNAISILNPDTINKSVNDCDAIKILIFDILIANNDRNKGNLLIDSVDKRLIMLDHTHVFELGAIWDETQLPRLIEEPFSIEKLHTFNYQNIIQCSAFNNINLSDLHKFIKRVKNINIKDLNQIMSRVPSDWNMTNNEKDLIKQYILSRFAKVDLILKLLNIKGGDSSEK